MEHQMKSKYNGLACLVIFASAGILLVIYGVMLSDQIAGSIQISRPASISDIKVPDASVMAYIDFLIPNLSKLSAGQDRLAEETKTDEIPKIPAPGKTALEKDRTSRLSYILTLSFTSPEKNFCMIDNKLYTQKDDLPDGGKILKIETGRVYILKDGKKLWLYPLQQ
jgi:hypothetical protein